MPAPAKTTPNAKPTPAPISPAISEAADLAAALITRSLRLLERAIAEQEASPMPPTIKEASAAIATIKRAADTLEILAKLQSASTDSPSLALEESTAQTSANREIGVPRETSPRIVSANAPKQSGNNGGELLRQSSGGTPAPLCSGNANLLIGSCRSGVWPPMAKDEDRKVG